MSAPTKRVLVVDDEPQIPRLVTLLLGAGYQVDSAPSAGDALARLEDTPYDVVLSDLAMPEMGGIELLRRARRRDPDTPFVVLTGQASVESAVEAMREGAFDYLRKTASAQEVRAAVDRAAQHGSLAREVRRLRDEVERVRGTGEIVAGSEAMRQLLALAQRIAPSDASVLILGESGTGKELLARTLHRLSTRREAPFVAFDCSALAPSLLESELFGHERGAFTGAARARRGLFREAHGGTLFLDEIGDIAPEVQNKLLRVLQEREIKPVGGDHFVKVDVRIVAATNKDLRALVGRGAFREDLYFRLAVVPLRVPALRERLDDLPLLCAHILSRRRPTGTAGERWPKGVSAPALARLAAYGWPGNVRELENVLARAALLADGDEIEPSDLPLGDGVPSQTVQVAELSLPETRGRSLKDLVAETVKHVERRAIEGALRDENGSPTRAAKRLGISRASLYNKLKEYDIAT